MSNGVSRIGLAGRGALAGIGYVVLPIDLDRDKYIKRCLRRSKVSIVDDNGAFIHNVYIDNSSLNKVVFPEDINGTGSAVFWVNVPVRNETVIVSVFNKQDESSDLKEHQFKIRRFTESSLAQISGNGDTGDVHVIANGDSGKFYLNAMSTKIRVKGSTDKFVDGSINTAVKEDFNITAGGKYNFGLAEEQGVLGNILHDLLLAYFTENYDVHQHGTSLGPTGPPLVLTSPDIVTDLMEILSETFYLD